MVTNRWLSSPLPSQISYENDACWHLSHSTAPPSSDLLTREDRALRPTNFRSVLVPLDGTAHGERALPLAVSIAKQARANLRLLHVYSPVQGDFYPRAYSGINGELYRRQLDYVRRVARQVGEAAEITVIPQCVRRQNIVQGISEVVNRSVDLVVASTHGHGWLERVWNGSTVHELVDQLASPMLILRGDGLRTAIAPDRWLRRLLIALDGSKQAERVLNSATTLGSLFEADHSLLTVVPRSRLGLSTRNDQEVRDKQVAAHDYLKRAAKRMKQRGWKSFQQVEVSSESVAKAIVQCAESSRVDCIAMARESHSGLRRWLQPSVTHRVIELAQVPVLVLPVAAQTSLRYESAYR